MVKFVDEHVTFSNQMEESTGPKRNAVAEKDEEIFDSFQPDI
jgi:hypothetical protein